MAGNTPDKQHSVSASQAMNIVLKAEQDAEHSISECKVAARHLLQETQQHTAKIARRTNRRISTLHLRIKQNLTHQISELERVAESTLRDVHDSSSLHKDKLGDAVDEVAASLIGSMHTGKSGR